MPSHTTHTPPYHHLHPLPPNPSKPTMKQSPSPTGPLPRNQSLLRPHHHTHPFIWCGAIFCVIITVLIILLGAVTLVVFLVIKPRNPVFEISGASLNAVYVDSPTYLNSDITFLANFSNPNTRMDIVFEYLSIELYYHDRFVAAQGMGPFHQRRLASRLEAVHMISSEVYLPVELAMEMQKEVRSNKVLYSVRGNFKVRASFGIGHVSYWVHGRCLIEMSAPPGGVLLARSCRTKR